MINVIVRSVQPVKSVVYSFDETVDDEAMKKALVRCDISTFSNESEDVITLDQDGRLLRFLVDKQVGWQFINSNGIYDGLVGEK